MDSGHGSMTATNRKARSGECSGFSLYLKCGFGGVGDLFWG